MSAERPPGITLKPCPFCGGEAEIERIGSRRASCIVACTNCGARHEGPDEGEQSGASWNLRDAATTLLRRERDDALAELDALRADIAEHLPTYAADAETETEEASPGETVEHAGVELRRLRKELEATIREADRLRHGRDIEGDHVCPDALRATEAERHLATLQAAAEQVLALRLPGQLLEVRRLLGNALEAIRSSAPDPAGR